MSTSPIASSIPVIQIQTSETDLQRVAQMAAEQALASVAHLLRQPTEWMSASQVARWAQWT
jgi:hypothetical protein